MYAREKLKARKCILYLFRIFIEEDEIMLKDVNKEIKMNGKSIHCIRFAEDIALVSDSGVKKIILSLNC